MIYPHFAMKLEDDQQSRIENMPLAFCSDFESIRNWSDVELMIREAWNRIDSYYPNYLGLKNPKTLQIHLAVRTSQTRFAYLDSKSLRKRALRVRNPNDSRFNDERLKINIRNAMLAYVHSESTKFEGVARHLDNFKLPWMEDELPSNDNDIFADLRGLDTGSACSW